MPARPDRPRLACMSAAILAADLLVNEASVATRGVSTPFSRWRSGKPPLRAFGETGGNRARRPEPIPGRPPGFDKPGNDV